MIAIRRLYLYLVAGASLAVLVTGLAQTGKAFSELVLGAGVVATSYRQTISIFSAMVIVSLPLWVVHWRWVQRKAQRDLSEQASAIRRLYIYTVLSGLLVALGTSAAQLLRLALVLTLRLDSAPDLGTMVGATWELAVIALVWVYVFRVAEGDRRVSPETGASATLRRWYAYGAQFVALIFALSSMAALLDSLLVNLLGGTQLIGTSAPLGANVAQTVVAIGIWLFHRVWCANPHIVEDDLHSTLRAMYGFLLISIAVAVSISNLGRVGSSRVDLQACKLEYSIVSPK